MRLLRPPLQARSPRLPEFDAYPTYNFLDMDFAYGKGAKLLDKSSFHTHGDIITAAWIAGVHHYALDFVLATPDYVEITAPQLNFTSKDFSIIVRVKIDALPASAALLSRGVYWTDGWYVFIDSATDRVSLQTHQDGAGQTSDTYMGVLGTYIGNWYTLGFSRSGTSVIIYKDGVDATLTSGTHTNPLTSARTLKLGIYDDKSSFPFDGKVEFLRFFGGIALPAEAHLWFHNQLK